MKDACGDARALYERYEATANFLKGLFFEEDEGQGRQGPLTPKSNPDKEGNMSCSIEYYGDTGYGGFTASRMICSGSEHVRPKKAAAEQPKVDSYEEEDSSNAYNQLYGMTGYAGIILMSMWRTWMR